MNWPPCANMKGNKENSALCRRVIRRMGFYADSLGIARRYIDQEGGWDMHMQRSRTCIVKALEGRQAGNLAVLGNKAAVRTSRSMPGTKPVYRYSTISSSDRRTLMPFFRKPSLGYPRGVMPKTTWLSLKLSTLRRAEGS